jgi:hypothetical protein
LLLWGNLHLTSRLQFIVYSNEIFWLILLIEKKHKNVWMRFAVFALHFIHSFIFIYLDPKFIKVDFWVQFNQSDNTFPNQCFLLFCYSIIYANLRHKVDILYFSFINWELYHLVELMSTNARRNCFFNENRASLIPPGLLNDCA